jgi:hypothetical protein
MAPVLNDELDGAAWPGSVGNRRGPSREGVDCGGLLPPGERPKPWAAQVHWIRGVSAGQALQRRGAGPVPPDRSVPFVATWVRARTVLPCRADVG